MSRKIPQVSKEGLASKPLNISCVMDNSWNTQESPLRNLDWLLELNDNPQSNYKVYHSYPLHKFCGKLGEETLVDNYWLNPYYPFMHWNYITSLPITWKISCLWRKLEKIKKKFNQGFITNFDHTYRHVVPPMSFTNIRSTNNRKNFSWDKIYWF